MPNDADLTKNGQPRWRSTVDVTSFALQFVKVLQTAGWQPSSSGELVTASIHDARPHLRECLILEHLQSAFHQMSVSRVTTLGLNTSSVRRRRPRRMGRPKINFKDSERPGSRLSATSASKNPRACRGASKTNGLSRKQLHGSLCEFASSDLP